jgi:molecular chaperone DnaK (HSP70)
MVRNSDMLVSTPTAVAFDKTDGSRKFGASAIAERSSNGENTFDCLNWVAGMSYSEYNACRDTLLAGTSFKVPPLAEGAKPEDALSVLAAAGSDAAPAPLSGTALMASFLSKLKQFAAAASPEKTDLKFVFAVPECFSDQQRLALLDGAKIAGMASADIVSTSSAMAAAYGKKHCSSPSKASDEERRHVMLLDFGHAQATACVLAAGASSYEILASNSTSECSSGLVDRLLFEHFQKVSERIPRDCFSVQPRNRNLH